MKGGRETKREKGTEREKEQRAKINNKQKDKGQ